MQEFAGEGLRTLALAYRDLDQEYFSQWKQRHHEVSTSLDDRDGRLDELYEEIETDLQVREWGGVGFRQLHLSVDHYGNFFVHVNVGSLSERLRSSCSEPRR